MDKNNNSNKYIKLKIKSFLKKISLQLYTLKESMLLQFLRLDGKAFHTVGPAWKKARSPKVFRVTVGTTSNVSESDRRLYLVLGFTTSSSDKYCGARPFNVLKTKSAILNSTLNFTGNQ